jgi:hypothetical protein
MSRLHVTFINGRNVSSPSAVQQLSRENCITRKPVLHASKLQHGSYVDRLKYGKKGE